MTSHINSENYLQVLLSNYIKNDDISSIMNIRDFLTLEDETILEMAFKSRNINIIKYFLYNDFAIPKEVENTSLLHYAIQYKMDEIFMDICNYYSDTKTLINYIEKYEENTLNLLLLAIFHNCSIDIIKYIINHTENLNYADDNGDTALILASKFMRKETFEILLEYDIDVNISNKLGYNVLFYLFRNMDIELINKVMKSGGKFVIDDVINLNIFKSNKAMIFDIIKDNIHSWTIEDNNTVMKICVDNKYYNLLYFFGKKININNIVIDENPILFYILDNFEEKSFKILIDILNRLSYDYNKTDQYNNNLLHYIFRTNPKLIFILEKYIVLEEISINHCNNDQETPLIYLFKSGIQTKDIYEKLFEIYKDIDILIKDCNHYTFIDYLLMNTQFEKIEEESNLYNINMLAYIDGKEPVFILKLADKYYSVYQYINKNFDFNIMILKNIKYIYEPLTYLIVKMYEDNIINKETIKVISYLIDYKKELPEDFIKYLLENNCITIIDKFEIIETYIKNHKKIDFLMEEEIYSEYLYYNKTTLLHYIVSIDLPEELMVYYISNIYDTDEKMKEHVNILDENYRTPIQVLIRNTNYMYIDEIFRIIEIFILFGAQLDLPIDNALNKKIPSYIVSNKNIIKDISKNILAGIMKYLDNNEFVEVCKNYENIKDVLEKIYENAEMKDNCYICYCNDIDDYYYECDNKHKYHHGCLMGYYNKVNIDINCFYCKAKYDFKKVYKCLLSKEE
jgi:hypothetical protein